VPVSPGPLADTTLLGTDLGPASPGAGNKNSVGNNAFSFEGRPDRVLSWPCAYAATRRPRLARRRRNGPGGFLASMYRWKNHLQSKAIIQPRVFSAGAWTWIAEETDRTS